jgi:hypothetical protein
LNVHYADAFAAYLIGSGQYTFAYEIGDSEMAPNEWPAMHAQLSELVRPHVM